MLPGAFPGMNDLVPEGAELPPSMGLNIPNLRPAPKPTRLKHAPPSTKLYHASSIDESQEVESESDMNRESESEGALSRLSSYDTMGIHWLDAEKLRPAMRTAFGHGLLDPKAKDNSLVHVAACGPARGLLAHHPHLYSRRRRPSLLAASSW
jgi:hypothetical protein